MSSTREDINILDNLDFIQRVADAIFSEYGAFVAFLMISLITMYLSREKAVKRNEELTDKILTTISENTEALSKMIYIVDTKVKPKEDESSDV